MLPLQARDKHRVTLTTEAFCAGDARRAKEYIFSAYKLSKQHQPKHQQTNALYEYNERLRKGEKYRPTSGGGGGGGTGAGGKKGGGGGGGKGGGGDSDALREQKRKEVQAKVNRPASQPASQPATEPPTTSSSSPDRPNSCLLTRLAPLRAVLPCLRLFVCRSRRR